jgi:mono/diheme cytochrome c family protein
MARSKTTIDDEEKSYGVVFLLAVGLLLAGAVWTVWDDNISRRPWKKYQTEFSAIQIDRARAEIAAEEKRLAGDAEYQKVLDDLAAAEKSLASGEDARRLAEIARARAEASTVVDEWEFNLRLKKSEIEEAWYEYEHAVLTGASKEGPKAHLDELERQKSEIDAALQQAEARRRQIDNEAAEIRSVASTLERKKQDLETERERRRQKLDQLVLRLGPFELPTIPKIQQVVLNEFDRNAFDQAVARVERCESCHAGIDKAGFRDVAHPFRTHPDRKRLLAKHPPQKFGCTPCHGGQGAAVNSVATAHGDVKFWEHKLRRDEMVQASCIQCHADLRLPHAATIARGEQLFEQLGCHGCHLVEGYGDLDRVGPYLRRIGAKLEPGWLVRWIENPHEFRARTKMPNFLFNREQAVSVASYLLHASREESDAWLADHAPPAGIDPDDAAQVARGKALADSLGCRGCHGFAPDEAPGTLGENKDIAPNLSEVAEKTGGRWLYHWLKDPRGYSPVSRMPSLRLSDEEAADLVAFLLTLGSSDPADAALRAALESEERSEQGAALVRKYGCAGCHDIPGMEEETRIGVELTTFGSKPLEELFFGNRTDVPHTWHDWTYNKLKTPRTYETERIEQVMPQFDLAEADIEALLIFLHSRLEERIPDEYRPEDLAREKVLVEGRRVVAKYNCVGCHVIEEQGGAILPRYEETPTMAPPILNGEGAKVQPNWLFGFLKRPITLRPWLEIRMPTFGLSDGETTKLVEYFLAQESVEVPYVHVDPASSSPEYIEAGRLLATEDYFNCFSCHQQGDRKPEGPREGWAPDLALARRRLHPEWIVQWLRNPQALQPGTKMPAFYDFSDEAPDGPDDVLGGDDAKQVEALRDYVLNIDGQAAAPAAAEPPVVEAAAQDAGVPVGPRGETAETVSN